MQGMLERERLMRGERKDDEWRMGGCKHCILVLDVEEKEGMTGSTWIPPAFLANLLHQPRLTVPSASTGSHAFWSPLGSASGKFWQETGGREERKWGIFSPPAPSPGSHFYLVISLTLQWSLVLFPPVPLGFQELLLFLPTAFPSVTSTR